MLEFLNPLFFDGCAVNFDLPILYWIQENLRSGFCDFFWSTITHFGDGGIFWIGWAALLLLFPKHRKTGLAMGIALVLGVLVCNLFLKIQVARPRPFNFPGSLYGPEVLLIGENSDMSFPSGHTIASFEAAVALILLNKKMGIPAMILAVFVSLSRLYLFVHYPTDVIASVILGSAFAFFGVWVVKKFYDRLPEKLRTVGLRLKAKE